MSYKDGSGGGISIWNMELLGVGIFIIECLIFLKNYVNFNGGVIFVYVNN